MPRDQQLIVWTRTPSFWKKSSELCKRRINNKRHEGVLHSQLPYGRFAYIPSIYITTRYSTRRKNISRKYPNPPPKKLSVLHMYLFTSTRQTCIQKTAENSSEKAWGIQRGMKEGGVHPRVALLNLPRPPPPSPALALAPDFYSPRKHTIPRPLTRQGPRKTRRKPSQ